MRAVLQRVTHAEVATQGAVTGSIRTGFVVLLGVEKGDEERDCRYIADKIRHLRVFEDAQGKMNLPIGDVQGSVLLVSQFTLCGDARHGRRPDFTTAASPDVACALYERVGEMLQETLPVQYGVFQADMAVTLCNDGPVTVLLDSRRQF